MSRRIVTANRLRDGAVVYLTALGRWSEAPAEAAVARDGETLTALLRLADTTEAGSPVVGAYAIAVEGEAGPIRPQGRRESIRAVGPTVRPDLKRPTAA